MAHLIYKLLLIGTVAGALSACGGGFDDLDAARAGGAGIGSTVTEPTDPNEPEPTTNWQYSQVAEGNRVLALTATTYARNTYPKPDNNNLRGTPWLQIKRNRDLAGAITDSVVIFADSKVSCTPFCDVRIRFDGDWGIYRMQNSNDEALIPLDRQTATVLFNKMTSSNQAIVSLPIIGLSNSFDAEFDLSGYDMQRMSF